jgi:hypothetical protein
VLPGEADPAVQLDVHPGVPEVGVEGDDGGDRGGEVRLGTRRDPRRLPGGGHGELAAHQHVGQVVLHGLEAADRPAELLADLRVFERGVQRRAGPSGGLGRGDRAQQPGGRGRGSEQHLTRSVDDEARHPERGVEAVNRLGPHRVPLQQDDVRAAADQVQPGPDRPDRRARVPAEAPVEPLDGAGERDGCPAAPVGEARQQGRLLRVRAALGEQRGGDDGRQQRSAADLPAEPFGHDRELRQAVAGAAVPLRQVQPASRGRRSASTADRAPRPGAGPSPPRAASRPAPPAPWRTRRPPRPARRAPR